MRWMGVLVCLAAACHNDEAPTKAGQGGGEGGRCKAAGASCDPQVAQDGDYVCVSQICRQACAFYDVACPKGQLCDTSAGYCADSQCAGYQEAGCEAGLDQRCVPLGNEAYQCVPVGTGTAQSECTTHADCALDHLCTSGLCAPTNVSQNCVVAEGCPGVNETCQPYVGPLGDLPIGLCLELCTAFAHPSRCEAGAWCLPGTSRDHDGYINGQCIAEGLDARGDACGTFTDCAAGLLCVGDAGAAHCELACDPQKSSAGPGDTCEATEQCDHRLGIEAGICSETCLAFADVCGPDHWCFPAEEREPDESLNGTCAVIGERAEGDTCGSGIGACAAGLMCLGSGGTSGECDRLCDPKAAPGGLGDTCDANDPCRKLLLSGGGNSHPVAYGRCLDGCVAFTNACADPRWCMPGETRNGEGKIIGTCVSAGSAAEGAACGSGHPGCVAGQFCLSLDGGTTYICQRLCDPGSGTSLLGDTCEPGDECKQLVLNTSNGPVTMPFGRCRTP